MKRCSKCKKEYTLKSFSTDSKTKDKLCLWCKSCQRKYYYDNKEKIKKRHSKYQKKNAAEIKKGQRRWRKENHEYILKKNREYRKNNPIKARKWENKYKRAHPEVNKKASLKWYYKNSESVSAKKKRGG